MNVPIRLSKLWKQINSCQRTSRNPRRNMLRRLIVESMEPRQLMAVIDLATLNLSQGLVVYGAEAGDQSGVSVSGAGDVNGDGYDDVIIGASLSSSLGNSRTKAGESYLVFGGPSLGQARDLATLGASGITIYGAATNDQSGFRVSGAGDVNGDGYDDLLVGAWQSIPFEDIAGRGVSYLIYGGNALPGSIDLASLGTPGGASGVKFQGIDNQDRSAVSVNSAGDMNGDGLADIAIGADFADGVGESKSKSGETYVIYGSTSLPALVNLSSVGAPGGVAGTTIFGAEANDQSGISSSRAGDFNGDGFGDLIIGAIRADGVNNSRPDSGDSYVVLGGPNLPTAIDLGTLGQPGGVAGVTLYGAASNDLGSVNVSGAGDVNGDGLDDVLISTLMFGSPGKSWVVFGITSPPSFIDLGLIGTFGNTQGILFNGIDNDDLAGYSASAAGDVNGDGFDDVMISAYKSGAANNTKPSAGESYVIFGAQSLSNQINLSAANTSAGITIFGANADDRSGQWVRSAGDFNGDGFADVVIGAFGGDSLNNARVDSGETYVVYGGNGFTNSVNPLGTVGNDTLNGNSAANIINGGRGNDILVANAGFDVLNGGQGNDVFAVTWNPAGSPDFKRIVGGTGTDTLRLDGVGLTLNLTTIRDSRITGIEVIDLTGSGDNTLTLSARDVLNLSDKTNTLLVKRNVGDVVNMGTGWTQTGSEVIQGTRYAVHTQGRAVLKIQQFTDGTGGSDAFVLTYSGNTPSSTVTVTLSTNGGPTNTLGVFPLSDSLFINGFGGNDSVRIVGSNSSDTVIVSSGPSSALQVVVNGQTVNLNTTESLTIEGGASDDLYRFDTNYQLGLITLDESVGGSDTLSFVQTLDVFLPPLPVTINLGLPNAQVVNSNLRLNLRSGATFENVVGGLGNDSIRGNSLANVLDGNAGNDSLAGGMGDDTYRFSIADRIEADTITELTGQGTDTVSFASIATPVVMTLQSGAVQNVHVNRTVRLNASTTFENLIGGLGDDTLTGNSVANVLTGGGGNDRLAGNGGSDVMAGGIGDDTYVFANATSPEADSVTELPGDGTDTLSFAAMTDQVFLNMFTAGPQNATNNRTLNLNSGITFENAIGGSGNDYLVGNDLANRLTGGSGSDQLNGGLGSDSLLGGLGDDEYVFEEPFNLESDVVTEQPGQGTDTLNFSPISSGDITLNLGLSTFQLVQSNRQLRLSSGAAFENFIGGSGNDTVIGNDLGNVLTGNSGNDHLMGGNGRDILIGGFGADILDGGADEDILIAGRSDHDYTPYKLNDLLTEWLSGNSYATRIANLRAGVGSSGASLFAMVSVLNDASEPDSLTGGSEDDWYFQAVDDLVVDLHLGEVFDQL